MTPIPLIAELRRLSENFQAHGLVPMVDPKTFDRLLTLTERLWEAFEAGSVCERGDTQAGRVGCLCAACMARLNVIAALAAMEKTR